MDWQPILIVMRYPPTLARKVLELLISRIMEEASSDPAMEVLLYEDFVKVGSQLSLL